LKVYKILRKIINPGTRWHNNKTVLHIGLLLALLFLSSNTVGSAQSSVLSGSNQNGLWSLQQQTNRREIYLPIVVTRENNKVLTGIYPQGFPGLQTTIDNEFEAIDAWVGQKLSIGGTFIDFEGPNPRANFKGQMDLLWNNGYTPFVNITTTRSAADVANGAIDGAIETMASLYAEYAQGNSRMAYLAPFPRDEWGLGSV
jgi:hypothetical protein